MGQIAPLLPFKIGPVNEREARKRTLAEGAATITEGDFASEVSATGLLVGLYLADPLPDAITLRLRGDTSPPQLNS
jgi:hypothetical protein